MAYTEAQLTALQSALASGALRVTHEGRTVIYRDIEDIQRAIATVESGLAKQAGQTGPATTYAVFNKGL